eukprot:102108-Prymnesium_polylepis.1
MIAFGVSTVARAGAPRAANKGASAGCSASTCSAWDVRTPAAASSASTNAASGCDASAVAPTHCTRGGGYL